MRDQGIATRMKSNLHGTYLRGAVSFSQASGQSLAGRLGLCVIDEG